MALVVHVAHYRQAAHDGHAGSITWHKHHALLAMTIRAVRIGLAHNDKNCAARAGCPRGPPFAPIEYILMALARDRELDIRGIGTGHLRLGHGKSRTNLAV